ncbi:immunoglobulin domain-containing protein [Prosthecobacter sp. SYSU 5D2]|uniref:immunoglobulin domain-containing protein n=1 Tax=Prosthecobacter sp. SYSU 5D2 TaxID=3134134 RepID=UPI0031FF1EF7
MKKFVLSALLLLSSLGSTQAANLFASNLGTGITLRDSVTPLSSGTVRFGVFPAGFDVAANANDIAALDEAFITVYSFTGNLNAQSVNGFFETAHEYDTSATYGGLPYDSSAGSTAEVAGDIAGSEVYVWVYNGVSPVASSEQAIFVTDQTWVDADDFVADTFVSIDAGALGRTAIAGQLSTGADIGAGAASNRAGGVLLSVTIARNPGDVSVLPGTAVTFTSNVIGGLGLEFEWFKNGASIEGETDSTLVIDSAVIDDTADYSVAVTSGATTVESNVLNLTVSETPPSGAPTIVQQPAPQIVAVGDSLDLSVGAVGPGTLRYQWKKGANVAGATTPSISIPNVTLKSAGAYSVQISNTPGAGTGTVTSAKAEVAVVDTTDRIIAVAVGGTAKLAVAASGKSLTYQWFKDGVSVSGATKKALSVKVTDATLAGEYVCVVTAPGGSLESGVQNVVLISEAPVFTGGSSITLPAGVVGGDYSVEIYPLMDQTPAKTPLSFKATKLPAGVKIDTKTGVISGRPTKAGTYSATITAVTSKDLGGSVVTTASITISDFPSGLAGTYVASVESDEVVGAGLGGRIDFTITTKGALSGKLLLGGDKVVPFKGSLVIPSGGGNPVLDIDIIRKTSYLPLNFYTEFNTTTGLLEGAELSQEGGSADVQGWKNTNVGATYAGLTTFGLQIPVDLEGNVNVPQGVSYGTITVKAPAGTLKIVGNTADGQKITGATFVGPDGQVVIHNALYIPFKGSLSGVLDLNRGATAAEDTITGDDVFWTRPAATTPKSKMYQAGFGPIALTPVGGRYVNTTGVYLDVAAGTTAELVFEEAGINPEANDPSVELTLDAKNKFTIAANPENTKLKLVSKTGAFSGNIVQPTNRKAKFQGVAVRTSPTTVDGLGYFTIPQVDDTTLSGYVGLSVLPPVIE